MKRSVDVLVVWTCLALLVGASGCRRKEGPPPQFVPESTHPVAGKFEDPEGQFSVDIPQGWSEQDTTGLKDIALLLQPDGDTEGVNINIQKEFAGQNMMLEEYCVRNDQNAAKHLFDFRPLGDRLLGAAAGAPASILHFTFTEKGKPYESKQYIFIIIPYAYQVILTAPEGTLVEYEDALNRLLNSWESTQAWEKATALPPARPPTTDDEGQPSAEGDTAPETPEEE